MRVAALYDIHGNLVALRAVLAELPAAEVDRVLVGGDVFPGPHGPEVLAALDALPLPVDFISGNGDADVVATRGGTVPPRVPGPVGPLLEWVAAGIDDRTAERIAGWPPTRVLPIDGLGPVLFCHATPESDDALVTRRTPDEALVPLLAGVEERTVICGHTHLPFRRAVRGRLLVNPGSVGMPFDAPEAAWAVLGPDVELRRTPYSLDDARDLADRVGYPGDFPMSPPGEEVMLARFDAVRS